MTSLRKSIAAKTGAVALLGLAGFNLAACSNPTPEESALHQNAVAMHVIRSINRCDLTGVAPGHAARLTKALTKADTENLVSLHRAGVTFCLDPRIEAAADEHRYRSLRAVYHRVSNTVALVDNGSEDNGNRLYSTRSLINKLATDLQDSSLPASPIVAGTRTRAGKTTVNRWRDPAKHQAVGRHLQRNPALLRPPLAPVARS